MDKFEILGFLLQDLRDNRGPDEEDLGPALLRETTRIFELMVQHGHLSRKMFDLTGLDDPLNRYSVPKKYSSYQSTNYPINFVAFANEISDWLLSKKNRKNLELIDIFKMIQEYSWLRIEIKQQVEGALVTVRSSKGSPDKFYAQVLVTSRT